MRDALPTNCTGEGCPRCSGEYCERHYDKPCECDVVDRHIPTELETAWKERGAYIQVIKGVHGALVDAATISVPCGDYTADLYPLVMQIVKERDDARSTANYYKRLHDAHQQHTAKQARWDADYLPYQEEEYER